MGSGRKERLRLPQHLLESTPPPFSGETKLGEEKGTGQGLGLCSPSRQHLPCHYVLFPERIMMIMVALCCCLSSLRKVVFDVMCHLLMCVYVWVCGLF